MLTENIEIRSNNHYVREKYKGDGGGALEKKNEKTDDADNNSEDESARESLNVKVYHIVVGILVCLSVLN